MQMTEIDTHTLNSNVRNLSANHQRFSMIFHTLELVISNDLCQGFWVAPDMFLEESGSEVQNGSISLSGNIVATVH